MKIIKAKKNTYHQLTIEELSDVVADAITYLGNEILASELVDNYDKNIGEAKYALEDFEIEEHEDFTGTWWLNVWVEKKTHAEQIAKALRASAKKHGRKVEMCGKFGELNPEEDGDRAGRRLVDFYLTDRDFPGCEYEEVEE